MMGQLRRIGWRLRPVGAVALLATILGACGQTGPLTLKNIATQRDTAAQASDEADGDDSDSRDE